MADIFSFHSSFLLSSRVLTYACRNDMIVLMFQTQCIVLSSDSTEIRTFEERGIMFGIVHYNSRSQASPDDEPYPTITNGL